MKIIAQFRIASIIVILLGIIHLCATPVIFRLFGTRHSTDLPSLYMFVMVGISTVFIGWLQYFIVKKLSGNKDLQTIFKATILFLCILGIGAVTAMWDNPFAYCGFLIAMYELILSKYLKTRN